MTDITMASEMPAAPKSGSAIYFDGKSNQRRAVALHFAEGLEIREGETVLAAWAFADIRRADGPSGMLRLSCLTATALARLEVRDAALAADLATRCANIDDNTPGRRGVAAIVGWSLAATVSIVAVMMFGVPLAADRLAPLVPDAFERRLGEAADSQIKTMFSAKVCDNAAGEKAFVKLMTAIREAAGLDTSVQSSVLSSAVPNAFALPGGRVYMFKGLLEKANNPDEIAGVLAHELGHLKHRDNMRGMIRDGGMSFLVGLLFGDITGSSALIFASRSLLTSSHSREAEYDADGFSIEIMHKLGRPTKPMGEVLVRVTGKGGKGLSIISSHPLSEDRLTRMTRENRPASGPPLLTPEEWQSLKSICDSDGKI